MSKFKTLRHIETVRNFIGAVVKEMLLRAERHDQTKLQTPEVEIFAEYTPKLRECTYGSAEYNRYLAEMQVALDHHYVRNRHHPEYFLLGPEFNAPCNQSPLERMTLIDIMEMLCDWKAATLRHDDGDIMKSIDINQKRFRYSDEVAQILRNTAQWMESQNVTHFAEES